MPRDEKTYSVFVASPDDVAVERDRLGTIIEEVNSSHARRTGVRLALLRWEHDVSPAFGSDPQAVINDQIPADYDVFVGIFWNKIGRATKRAESGAVEEYEAAKARFDKDPNSVRLMLYFKNTPPTNMDQFDPDQYKAVLGFRSRVNEEGGLYREFGTDEDFTNYVRIDLTRLVYDLSKAIGSADVERPDRPEAQLASCEDESVEKEEDVGIFELEEAFEGEMAALNAVLGRMTEAIQDIGDSTNQRVLDLQPLSAGAAAERSDSRHMQMLRADAKRVLKHAANDMSRFVGRMKPEFPLFRQHLERAVHVFTKAIPMFAELNVDRSELKDSIRGTLGAMDSAIVNMQGMRDAVRGLPPMTAALVRSRRETTRLLQELIDIMRNGKESLGGVLSMLP